MNMNYPLGDLLTRIRNAQQARMKSINYTPSKFSRQVLNVLQHEGYILSYKESEIFLKYYEGKPVIQEIKAISTPGRRVYSSIKKLPKAHSGLGIYILSTSKGVVSDRKARSLGLGGEILCRIF